MRRSNIAIVALGIVVAAVDAVVSDPYLAVVASASAVLAGLTLDYEIPRKPQLVVSYVNPQASNRPVVWNDSQRGHAHLIVQVENVGRAPARAVEIEFDYLGMQIFNGSGNSPDSEELNIRVNPPRFTGGDRVLNPGDSPWKVAGLFATERVWQTGTARWRARAEGMTEQTGMVEIRLLEGPPPADA
jgi:hypothetical protein